jgi:four helix bundle protein
MTEQIKSYRDLRVYQAAFELQQEIFEVSKAFPKEEMFSLTNQIRRSSRAIGANLSESWQKRRYPAHFINKLSDSDAEQAETQHWLDTALHCKYISRGIHATLLERCQEIGRMLGTMINKPSSFCRQFSK